ncbi:unnamed protein product [Prorocentrum cordatum]|uniref:Uncharacterized protein n=1 Tax=Prorocentrum cordatum TaxID=2364126 RepID=A0ABN9UMT2_9DINO|nr:unnamed protein product [Polarella glacialis]
MCRMEKTLSCGRPHHTAPAQSTVRGDLPSTARKAVTCDSCHPEEEKEEEEEDEEEEEKEEGRGVRGTQPVGVDDLLPLGSSQGGPRHCWEQ